MHKTFPEAGGNYERYTRHDADGYYEDKKRFYRQYGILGIAKWKDKGQLPYCYLLYKRKDIYRTRPIVACRGEPHRKHLRIAGRALLFIMKELSKRRS